MRDLLTAFGVVFIAELGDKTQLAAAGFATRHRARLVAAGVIVGYVVVSTLSVAIGAVAGAAFPTRAVNIAAAVLFLAVGVATLRADDRENEDGHDAPAANRAPLVIIGSVALAMVLAELGDKTMLATISLAAGGDTITTWIGATAGITSAGLLGVAFGDAISRRVPPRAVRLGAGWLFIAIGALVLAAELR
ncbi:MAG: TMEM165/GDT1 family protein [Actinomycetota bacterium]